MWTSEIIVLRIPMLQRIQKSQTVQGSQLLQLNSSGDVGSNHKISQELIGVKLCHGIHTYTNDMQIERPMQELVMQSGKRCKK